MGLHRVGQYDSKRQQLYIDMVVVFSLLTPGAYRGRSNEIKYGQGEMIGGHLRKCYGVRQLPVYDLNKYVPLLMQSSASTDCKSS